MAFSVVLKRFLAPNALKFSSVRDVHPAVASRFFSKNALVSDYDTSEDDRSDLEVDRRSNRGVSNDRRGFRLSPFSDVFDLVPATRSLSEVLNLMDRMTEFPPFSSPSFRGASPYRAWDAKETEDALHLRMDMPGLGKEDVRVSVEQNTLVIKGEVQEKSKDEDAETGRKYSSRIDLPEKLYNTGDIKAEMKNGVLKVTVPKVKEEERSDVFHVQIN